MEATIKDLAVRYLNDKNYRWGIINNEWVNRVTEELHLRELSDKELSEMWDTVYETLSQEKNYKYADVRSAFVEVVNEEARRRRMRRENK